jgi:hypothetical protein
MSDIRPREAIALAMASARDVDVRRNDNGSFRITFDVEIDSKTLALISAVAKRHERSLGLQVWKYVADIFRAWRRPTRRPDPADFVSRLGDR